MYHYLLTILLIFTLNCKIKSQEDAKIKMQELLQKTINSGEHTKAGVALFYSNKQNLLWKFSATNNKKYQSNSPITPDQPFHVASIGKIFTSVLVLQLVEQDIWNLNDPIIKYIDRSILKNLFLINGKDYSDAVTIEHLLTHTSGAADYFEHEDFLKGMIKEKNKFWKPLDIIDYTSKNYTSANKPNEKFLYSDTGYIILGLMLEAHFGKSFEEILLEKILIPLDMKSTYMHLRSRPIHPNPNFILPIMLGEEDLTNANSVSSDWAGGGLISTTEDLLKFYKALNMNLLIQQKTFESMRGNNKFMSWIYYGKGLMSVQFGDMFFFIPKAPVLYGHSGLLGTQLFYSPDLDAYFILSISSTEDVGKSFELLYKYLDIAKELNSLPNQ